MVLAVTKIMTPGVDFTKSVKFIVSYDVTMLFSVMMSLLTTNFALPTFCEIDARTVNTTMFELIIYVAVGKISYKPEVWESPDFVFRFSLDLLRL